MLARAIATSSGLVLALTVVLRGPDQRTILSMTHSLAAEMSGSGGGGGAGGRLRERNSTSEKLLASTQWLSSAGGGGPLRERNSTSEKLQASTQWLSSAGGGGPLRERNSTSEKLQASTQWLSSADRHEPVEEQMSRCNLGQPKKAPTDRDVFLDPLKACDRPLGKAEKARQAYAGICFTGCSVEYFNQQVLPWAVLIRTIDAERDILLAWPMSERKGLEEIRSLVEEADKVLGSFRFITLEALELSEKIRRFMTYPMDNCCGAAEMYGISLWSLEDSYDTILKLDFDTRVIQPVDELFACDKEFIGSHGPASPINGGMFILRTSRASYKAQFELLLKSKYTRKTGWNCAGPNNKPYPGKGSSTLQGWLYYFFFVVRPVGFRVDMGKYDWQLCCGHATRWARTCSKPEEMKICHKGDRCTEKYVAPAMEKARQRYATLFRRR